MHLLPSSTFPLPLCSAISPLMTSPPHSPSSINGCSDTASAVDGCADLILLDPKPEPADHPSPLLLLQSNNNIYSEFHRISEMFRSAFHSDPEKKNAIVLFDGEESRRRRRELRRRPSELARVSGMGEDDRRYFREAVRGTRMVYDSLRILQGMVEERERKRERERERDGGGGGGRGRRWMSRGHLTAACIMRGRGMWMSHGQRIVGEIPGVEVGDCFSFRIELCLVGLHGQMQAGIDYLPASLSSNGQPVATSVVVSGGYEDDEDSGEVIVYTGHGGQDKNFRQCGNQKLEGGNLALERSMRYGIEVRVIRGFKYKGGPTGKVYVYDGLYKILDSWFDVGKSGFGVYKYKLCRMPAQPDMGTSLLRSAQRLRIDPTAAAPYLSLDISGAREPLPVRLHNAVDGSTRPLLYHYTPSAVFPPPRPLPDAGCACSGAAACAEASGCRCLARNGGDAPYAPNGALVRGRRAIFECGPLCRCPPGCRFRVSQHGLRLSLEVFRRRAGSGGWGVRSVDLIAPGCFVCEYAGLVLSAEQAAVLSMNGDYMVRPEMMTGRWSEWGDLTRVYPDQVPPVCPDPPPLDFAIDVSRMRNVAAFVRHSGSPNLTAQLVFWDQDGSTRPRVMLFSTQTIPPLRELTLDYGFPYRDGDGDDPKVLSICN